MHDQRIAAGFPACSTVWGLGVCDVLRVGLEPGQLPWLIDELDELRGPLEEQLQRTVAAADREALLLELATLRRMRAQLPAAGTEAPAVFAGPAETVAGLVRAALRNTAAALAELVQTSLPPEPAMRARLQCTAEAAAAWARTYLDCQAVEAYAFEPS